MIRWLKDIDEEESKLVGWKAKNLSIISDSNINVPKGFVITSKAFEDYKEYHRINNEIQRELGNVNDFKSARRASESIKEVISEKEIPEKIIEEIKETYSEINVSKKVREAGKKAIDLVGNQRTYENVVIKVSPTDKNERNIYEPEVGVSSKKSLENSIKKIWKRYFSPEAIFYRSKKGIEDGSLALIVQKMVETEKSGTVYTRNPSNKKLLEMESAYGLGIGLKKGDIIPDRFEVERDTGKVVNKDVVDKKQKYSKNPATGKINKNSVSKEKRSRRSLSTDKFSKIVNTSLKIERKLGNPVKVDFGIKKNRIYIFCVKKLARLEERKEENSGEKILEGTPVGKETVRGSTKLIYSDRSNASDSILVSDNSGIGKIHLVEENIGIITEKGGRSSYLSVLCEELDFPAIVRTKNAMEKLSENEEVVMNCSNGEIYRKESFVEEEPALEEDKSVSKSFTSSKIFRKGEKIFESSVYGEKLIKTEKGYQKLFHNLEDVENDDYFLIKNKSDAFRLNERINVLIDLDNVSSDLDTEGVKKFVDFVSENSKNVKALVNRYPERELLVKMVEAGIEEFLIEDYLEIDEVSEELGRAEKQFIIQKLRDMER